MKKTLIALLLSTSILLMTGCGSADKATSKDNSTSQTETTNSVDSKDKKIPDNSDKKNEEKESTTSKEENATTDNSKTEKSEAVSITIFIPNDNLDGLNNKNVTINHLTAYSIVNALVSNKVLPSGTTALNFETKNNIGYLDVSSSIYNSHSGVSGETLMLDALRETFLKAFNLEKVKLTVDGSTYTGSHVDLAQDDYL